MHSPVFLVIAVFTLASAVAAISFRNLVHCTLCAALCFGGLAAMFLQLGAEFVGLAQVLVYVGAVAILIVFAILLTRGSEPTPQPILTRSAWVGFGVAGLVALSLGAAILSTSFSGPPPVPAGAMASVGVGEIGVELMTDFVLPLEITALLLTAATIGAVLIAMHDRPPTTA
jgi:NADH-quinone oxidoreductase subunit J